MPAAPLPPGVVARLGSTAYRLDGRYGTVFLLPPHFRSYVASDGDGLREYDLLTGEPGRVILPRTLNARLCGLSADGKRLAVSSSAGYQILRAADQTVLFTVPHEPGAMGFVMSANGRRVAVPIRNTCTEQREADRDMEGAYVREVAVYAVGPRVKRRAFRPLLNFNLNPHLSPDGRYLAVTGEWAAEHDDQERPFEGYTLLQVWDARTGREVFRYTPADEVRNLSVAFAGDHLLIGTWESPIVVYDLAAGEPVRRFTKELPDGRYALSSDGAVLVGLVAETHELVRRDARTGKVLSETPSPFGRPPYRSSSAREDERTLHDLGVRADGEVVVLQSVVQTVSAWTAPAGEALTKPTGGSVPAKAVVFTADGREVLTAGAEPVARRWDAQSGELHREIKLPKDMADRMALVQFDGPDRLVADSAYGGGEFDLKTGKAKLTDRVSWGEMAWGEFRSADGWLIEFWVAEAEKQRLSRGTTQLRLGRVGGTGRRVLAEFASDWYAATADRGRVLLMYDHRDEGERTLVGFRVNKTQAKREWERTFAVGPEFREMYRYDPQERIDVSKVAYVLAKGAILWSPNGVTALVIPQREQVPFLIDPETGETVSQWTQPIRGPHAVHPHRPLLATCSPRGQDLLLLDWRTGELRAVLLEQCYPHALAWSPDGTRLAASLPDGTAYIFAPSFD